MSKVDFYRDHRGIVLVRVVAAPGQTEAVGKADDAAQKRYPAEYARFVASEARKDRAAPEAADVTEATDDTEPGEQPSDAVPPDSPPPPPTGGGVVGNVLRSVGIGNQAKPETADATDPEHAETENEPEASEDHTGTEAPAEQAS